MDALGVRGDLHPVGLKHLGDDVGVGRQAGETVVAQGVGDLERLALVKLAVAVLVEVNGPARQRRLGADRRATPPQR